MATACSFSMYTANNRIASIADGSDYVADGCSAGLDRYVKAKGGIVVGNGAPQTRTWLHSRLSVNFDEPTNVHRAYGPQLYTPLMLSKDNGERADDDPRYDLSVQCGITEPDHGHSCRWQNLLNFLDFGTLTFGWDWMFANHSTETVNRKLFPLTPIELGRGWVRGKERIVTKVSGRFIYDGTSSLVPSGCMKYFYTSAFLTHSQRCETSPWPLAVSVELAGSDLCIVVWS